MAEAGAEASEKDQKKLKGDGKELWKLLKQLKVTPGHGQYGQPERDLVQGITLGHIPLAPKLKDDLQLRVYEMDR